MGRGRQKAKHTKVARDLKYFSPNTDLSALEKELATETESEEFIDKWADLYPDEEESAEDSEETGEESK